MEVSYLQRPKRASDPLELELQVIVSCVMWVQDPNPVPLEKQ